MPLTQACRGIAPALAVGNAVVAKPSEFTSTTTLCLARFGPVLVTMSFADEAEALALANNTEYGLVASVWSGEVARGLRMAEQIAAGQVSVNGGPSPSRRRRRLQAERLRPGERRRGAPRLRPVKAISLSIG